MRGINAYHDSTSLRFREPFGALRCGDEVLLRLTVSGPDAERVNAVLRIWNGAESFLPAQSE